MAMFDSPDKFVIRGEPLRTVLPGMALVTDASPRGVGAILADIDRANNRIIPLEALEIPFKDEYAKWIGHTMG